MPNLIEITEPWLLEEDSNDLLTLRANLLWLKEELFDEYEPNRYERFDDRVATWLKNLPDGEDRKSLFRLLGYLFFVGKRQFDALCRAAFNDDVKRWLIDTLDISLFSKNVSSLISEAVNRTWFCPITDSMRINSFLKLNNLEGHDHRPDWRSLEEFGDPLRIEAYMVDHGIDRLVLLEDFVGSGNQMASTINWAATNLPSIPILVIPLVCCPDGVRRGASISAKHPTVTFAPTLTLREELFLKPDAQAGEPALFALVREIVNREDQRLGKWRGEPFGYEKTGGLVTLYSNCPDNTLPIIHDVSDSWAPLFTRVQRN